MKMVFKIKQDSNGEIARFKSRLVACGYSQQYGIDYMCTDAPCVKLASFRLIVSMVAKNEWPIFHCDVKTVHLNPELEEEIYAHIPKELNWYFGKSKNEVIYVRLRKSLYGLKQAGHNWAKSVKVTMTMMGWIQCKYDECVYWKKKDDKIAIAVVQVDDFAVTGSWIEETRNFAVIFGKHYETVDNGELEYFMARFHRENGLIYADQTNYLRDIATHFGQNDARPTWMDTTNGQRSLKATGRRRARI